ncbi:SulP family inorganic anion transporter [Actinomycetota bacterium]
MTAIRTWFQTLFDRRTIKDDAVAGLVLGVESVPDGLAGGLLAGVNPVYGLYGYMLGTFTGAVFTSATFMAVQATGAMAIVVADVPQVQRSEDPNRALFTLAILTGAVMLAAGFFKLGTLLRWVSRSVMVGFINAVGVNIILGQLDDFSGYEAEGGNRVVRAFDLLFNLGQAHWPTMAVGAATIVLIIVLERTRLGALGLVVAIIVTSGIVVIFDAEIEQLRDITDIPGTLPLPTLPDLSLVFSLLLPAVALAFVGLVQGAGISASIPNADGTYPDASQDFVGQGAANVASGLFSGMPVGGSMSATSLVRSAGARSKLALLIAGVVMAIAILVFSEAVGYISMPALAGLLMLVGYRTIKPADLVAVWKTGPTQGTVMVVTFILTMIIALQNAVLVGIGISVILYVIKQSNRMVLKRWVIEPESGGAREIDPPDEVGDSEVIVLQPYGSVFFATAATFEELLPEVGPETRHSVVILRFRGLADPGATFMQVVERYAQQLAEADSRLLITYVDDKVRSQLEVSGVIDIIGEDSLYESDQWLGATVRRAHADAVTWIDGRPDDG